MALEMQKKDGAIAKTTQSFLKLNEIKDDTVIMQDGTLRAIVAVSSTNFDLKSEDEQNALIYNYQRFLNSLEFPVQILMQSRRIEIEDNRRTVAVHIYLYIPCNIICCRHGSNLSATAD